MQYQGQDDKGAVLPDEHEVLPDETQENITPLEEILDAQVIPDEAKVIEAPRMTLRADPEKGECKCEVPLI